MYAKWITALVCLLVFLAPTNLFLTFPNGSEYINGLRVDYLIPKLYLTDLVVAMIFGLVGIHQVMNQKQRRWQLLKWHPSPIDIGVLALLSLFIIRQLFTALPVISVLMMAKLMGAVILAWLLLSLKKLLQPAVLHLAVVATIIFQASLGLYQWLSQQSLYGYTLLGEPQLSLPLGLAKTTWQGRELILPYGTTAHPNVLAGALVVYLLYLLFNFKQWKNTKLLAVLTVGVMVLGTLMVLLTTSVSAYLAYLFGIGILLIVRFKKQWITALLLDKVYVTIAVFLMLATAAIVIVSQLATMMPSAESFVRRAQLNSAAFELFSAFPITGSGLGMFTYYSGSALSVTKAIVPFLQPAHNLLLLFMAEAGLIGFGTLLTVLFWLSYRSSSANQPRRLSASFLPMILALIPLASFDHYLYTLQTGLLLVAMTPLLFSKAR